MKGGLPSFFYDIFINEFNYFVTESINLQNSNQEQIIKPTN